jgi:hypothetical protein
MTLSDSTAHDFGVTPDLTAPPTDANRNLIVLEGGAIHLGYAPGLRAVAICLVAGYGGLVLIDYWDAVGRLLIAASIPIGIGSGILLTRAGLLNPWKRESEWQREAQLDWKGRAWSAERYADRIACAWIGTKDADTARQRVEERVVRFEQGRRRGRPPGTPSYMTREKSLEIAADIRRLMDGGLSLPQAAKRHSISVEAARNYLNWLEDEEAARNCDGPDIS